LLNTGSGKSYTLAKIYRQLFKKYENNENFKNKAKFIIIDFNGLILLRKLKITPFSTFLDSLDKNSFINALTDSSEILVFLIVLLKNGCWVFSVALPLIENTCFLITKEEFNNIHQFVDSEDKPIKIGQLEFNDGVDISLGINKLFASHIGIFGNTGSGKSYTLAKIYRQLFEEYKNNENFKNKAKFIIIDFNGEYIDDAIIDKNGKNSYNLTTKAMKKNDKREKLPISKSTIENIIY
jgi:DNA helicase HerA-like ATPase